MLVEPRSQATAIKKLPELQQGCLMYNLDACYR